MSSAGPNVASSATQDSSYGTNGWNYLFNTMDQDDDNGWSQGHPTFYLVQTGFGFSIPAGATIDGILVVVRAYTSINAVFDRVRIVKGGTIGSTELSGGESVSNVDWTNFNFGGASSLWGESWDVDSINASNFGVAVTFNQSSSAVYVAWMTVTVYYTPASTGQPAIKRMSGVKFNAGPFGLVQGIKGW